jgi:hypothetical protein
MHRLIAFLFDLAAHVGDDARVLATAFDVGEVVECACSQPCKCPGVPRSLTTKQI